MPEPPVVVVTRRLPAPVEERLVQFFDAQMNPDDVPMTAAALAAAIGRADVLVPTVTDRIDAAILDAAGPNLRLIANFGAGVDNIDLDAANARGIVVTNTPGVLTEDTADIAMALILAVPRRLVEGARVLIDSGDWPGWSPTWMVGHRLGGRTLGIVGMGRIGRALAKRAAAFGLAINYHNRRRLEPEVESALGATWWDSLDQMLARMDFVSVNCPHTPATYHLLSARRLRLMKPDAILINTARGSVVDEKALVTLIEEGKLGGAGLDVFEEEPFISPRLVRLARAGRVVLLPHMGSSTIESRVAMGEKVIVNIRAFLDGHEPPNRVLPGSL